MKRVLRFDESRAYHFHFDYGITKGTVVMEIQSAQRETVLLLDENKREGVLFVEAKERYYLLFRFVKAHGRYELYWK